MKYIKGPIGAHLRLSALILPLFAASCSDGCDNEIFEKIVAPGGAVSAVIFSRGCGATTAHNIQISIVSSGVPDGAGNVFVADGHIPGRPGPQALDVRWLSPRNLQISYAPELRVFKSRTTLKGVDIRYSTSVPAK